MRKIGVFLIALIAVLLMGTELASASGPPKVKLKELSCKEKTISASWSKSKGAAGYQIKYETEGDRGSIYVSSKKLSKSFSVNLADSQYKVKVRAYIRKKGKKVYSAWSKAKKVETQKDKWDLLLEKYATKENVKQLIFVKYIGESKAELLLYSKSDAGWECLFKTRALVGRNGIDKKREGDGRTPTGTYNITFSFGMPKEAPSTQLSYKKINSRLYWCTDKKHYNKMIDAVKLKHKCKGEHLINYKKAYYYCIAVDYNRKCKYNKGSAIFLHCISKGSSTSGCIAVTREEMEQLLEALEPGSKICIYKK